MFFVRAIFEHVCDTKVGAKSFPLLTGQGFVKQGDEHELPHNAGNIKNDSIFVAC